MPDDLAKRWLTVRSVISSGRPSCNQRKGTVDTPCYIILRSKPQTSWHYIRQHWRIEHCQYYVLNVVFKEDRSRTTLDSAVEKSCCLDVL